MNFYIVAGKEVFIIFKTNKWILYLEEKTCRERKTTSIHFIYSVIRNGMTVYILRPAKKGFSKWPGHHIK